MKILIWLRDRIEDFIKLFTGIPTTRDIDNYYDELDELKKERIFMNYQCPYCGKIISRERSKINRTKINCITVSTRWEEYTNHNCTHEMQPDEMIYFKALSSTIKPMPGAVKIIYMDKNKD